jgi:hypothetical protein
MPERTIFLSPANKEMDYETQRRKNETAISTEPAENRIMTGLDMVTTGGAEGSRNNVWSRPQACSMHDFFGAHRGI